MSAKTPGSAFADTTASTKHARAKHVSSFTLFLFHVPCFALFAFSVCRPLYIPFLKRQKLRQDFQKVKGEFPIVLDDSRVGNILETGS
jgi:hypothetical protein